MPSSVTLYTIINQYNIQVLPAALYCGCCMETHLHVRVSLEGEELCCNCVTCSGFSEISNATEIYPLIIAIFSMSVVVAVVI